MTFHDSCLHASAAPVIAELASVPTRAAVEEGPTAADRGAHSTDGSSQRTSAVRSPLKAADVEFARGLFSAQSHLLYRYLRRLLHSTDDAQEAVQETFLRVLRQPQLDRIRQAPKAYLFQTATNLARDWIRQRARVSRRSCPEEIVTHQSQGCESSPELALEGEQTCQRLVAELERMKPAMRAALLLRQFDDLPHKEIARRLGISERTVERYIKDGLSLIAECVEKEHGS
jgi:RNA polymerase sigma factor (sigma-70 family)